MSSTGRPGAQAVQIGSLAVGAGPVVVLGGAPACRQGADGRWLRPRAGRAAEELAAARSGWDGPLLAEPASPGDAPAVAAHADGVVLAASAWSGAPALARAACALALPVVVTRGAGTSLDEWLTAAARCADEGARGVVLCEDGGAPGGGLAVDLGAARAARALSGRPVLAAPGDGAELAAAVVAAGADGLWLGAEAGEEAVAAAREAVTVVGALVRDEHPATLTAAREAIDRVDAALAVLLERRAGLAGTVQRLKPVGGFAGRDMERERRLVAAMARRAPLLGEERLAPVMNAVIEAGLHLAEQTRAAARRAHESGPRATDPDETQGTGSVGTRKAGRDDTRATGGGDTREAGGGDTRENGAERSPGGTEGGPHQGDLRRRAAVDAFAADGPDHD
ncbi:chorismate mutase [Sphaerisporangium dianthi]|uniref:Chorismate mutase n=1 Tax=Sphaerisporangium dianthi TaxID=1436120 RepID=A0ABV9CKJ9_9ACTN